MPQPQQQASGTPQRLDHLESRCRNSRLRTPQRLTFASCLCRNSWLQRRRNVLITWKAAASTVSTRDAATSNPSGSTRQAISYTVHTTKHQDVHNLSAGAKRWLADKADSLASQYFSPRGPAIDNHLIHRNVHNHVSRRRVAFDARNQSPRTLKSLQAISIQHCLLNAQLLRNRSNLEARTGLFIKDCRKRLTKLTGTSNFLLCMDCVRKSVTRVRHDTRLVTKRNLESPVWPKATNVITMPVSGREASAFA